MESVAIKTEAKNLIDALDYDKTLLVIKYVKSLENNVKIAQMNHVEPFVFDSLVQHTERAEKVDEYIRELRDNVWRTNYGTINN